MFEFISKKYQATKTWVVDQYNKVCDWFSATVTPKLDAWGFTTKRYADCFLVLAIVWAFFFPLLAVIALVVALVMYHKHYVTTISYRRKLAVVRRWYGKTKAVFLRRLAGTSREDEIRAKAKAEAEETTAAETC